MGHEDIAIRYRCADDATFDLAAGGAAIENRPFHAEILALQPAIALITIKQTIDESATLALRIPEEFAMRAKDVMSDGVVSIAATATVHEATKLLVNTHVTALPVLDANGVMVGIVSEADVIKEAARPADPAPAGHAEPLSRPVAEIMMRDVVTADENASLGEIAALMIERRVKRVPVLRDGRIVGVVSRVDLLQALLSNDPMPAASTPAAAAPSGPPPGPTPSGAPSGDETLRAAVVAAVSGQSWSLARRADVVAKDGIVHLWGVVPSQAVLENYAAAAGKVAGVNTVQVHMHVMQR